MSDAVDVSGPWQPLIAAARAPAEVVTDLRERYAEPQRRYHGVAHIDALARLFDEVAAGPGWSRPAEVALAILFHDAVYEPGARDNEARSAALARAALTQAWGAGVDVERVAAWIEATASHGSAPHGDPDLDHFLDADVAILGAPPTTYERYAQGVRDEFAPRVGAAAYRAGRAAFLTAQLDQPALFRTPWFAARFGAQARANLARELASLAAPVDGGSPSE